MQHLTFGESALNSGRIILLFGRPDPFYASLLSVSNCILQPIGSYYSDVMSTRFVVPAIADNHLKFGDPRLNVSQEIPPEAV